MSSHRADTSFDLQFARIAILGPISPFEIISSLASENNHFPKTFSDFSPVNQFVSRLKDSVGEICVITFSRNFDYVHVSRYENISFNVVPMRNLKTCLLDNYRIERIIAKRILDMFGPTLTHAHWTYEYALTALDTEPNAIVTVHDSPFVIFWFFRDFLRFYRLVQSIIVRIRIKKSNLIFVSSGLYRSWKRTFFIEKKAMIIPNFSRFEFIDKPNFPKNRQLMTIGNATRLKNVETLLKAFEQVKDEFPDLQLHLCGDGLDSSSSMYSKWNPKFGANVIWHGQVDAEQIWKLLNQTLLYIHPSLEESQGMAIVEAMSLGVPVMVHEAIDALKETCGESAYYVNCFDPESLGESICDVLRNGDELRVKKGKVLKQAQKIFDPEKNLFKILEFYTQRIQDKRD